MRYAILSDIHGNLAALEAILADLGTVDGIWCLGDIVGYGPNPNECIERLEVLPHVCIAGNHDWGVLGRLDLDDFSHDAHRALVWTQKALTSENREYLEQLTETLMVGEDSFMLAHGSPRHPIWEYLFSVSTARANFDHFSNHVCFVGHTHIQSIFVQDGKKYGAFEPLPEARLTLDNEMRFIINPGSVGQPRDGNPDASYAILDTEQNTIEFRRLPYPIEVTQERMREHHLPSRLIERLNYGI